MATTTTTTIKTYPSFVCPGCAEMVDGEPGTTIDGIKCCSICVEQRQDELAIKVRERLRKGELRWGRHYLAVRVHPVRDELVQPEDVEADKIATAWLEGKYVPEERGFFILDVVCHCGNANHSHVDLFRSRAKFWEAFSEFVNKHYDQLKLAVK